MSISEAQARVLLGRFYAPPKTKKPKKSGPKAESVGEAQMAIQLRIEKIPYQREYKFCPDRRWKSDFLIIGTKILVEVEGGTWSGGRHTRGKGYENDCEKYAWAASHGWLVLRYTTAQVNSGFALASILMTLKNTRTK